jgi:16S rRNA processing protein RimM
VKTKPFTDRVERFKRLRYVYLGHDTQDFVEHEVAAVEIHGKIVLVKFVSICDKSAADGLIGLYIFVDTKEIEKPKKGRYFIHDVVGCIVQTTDNRKIGIVKEVYKMPAQDLWEVDGGKKCFMIPAVKEFIRSVDLNKRVITVNLIDGLIDAQV